MLGFRSELSKPERGLIASFLLGSEAHRRASFRQVSAGRTDGPLNTPHTRTDARFSRSLCLIPAEAKRSPSPCSADGQPAGYEAQ
jgi:hypothetical protein